MKQFTQILDIRELVSQYDVIVFDLWGVIFKGAGVYPGSVEAINHIIETKETFFLSNVPRKISTTYQKMISHGIKANINNIITSGDLTNKTIKSSHQLFNLERPIIYNLGDSYHSELWDDIDFVQQTDNITEANLMVLSATYAKLEELGEVDKILSMAQERLIPAICANPDKISPVSALEFLFCSGSLALEYEKIGGKVVYVGKPKPEIFLHTLERAKNINPKKALMIGDTLETDILGANGVGMDSGLVLTGNAEILTADLASYLSKIEKINHLINQTNIVPTYLVKLF